MSGTTIERRSKFVKLKVPPYQFLDEPYNKFEIQYTVMKTLNGPGKTKVAYSDVTLKHPKCLGLNKAWLHNQAAPVDQAAYWGKKISIYIVHLKFPCWGHLIHNSIQKFNMNNPHRCRKLVYDLRHGEADHNAWKNLFKKSNALAWATNPEYKRQPIFTHKGKQYCIIDPPLTARGEKQARCTNKMFLRLKNHMFPMPKRAYVSPMLRTMQTFLHGLKDMGIGRGDSLILDELREKKTGNCADILIDEYTRPQNPEKPPEAGTGAPEWETDKEVQDRADTVQKKIFEMDDSDCIVRVTHSLLIQNNLARLEEGGDKELQAFMLAEGGVIAYIIEGDRPNKERARMLRKNELKKGDKRWDDMSWRRKSAFHYKICRTPAEVKIESTIRAV